MRIRITDEFGAHTFTCWLCIAAWLEGNFDFLFRVTTLQRELWRWGLERESDIQDILDNPEKVTPEMLRTFYILNDSLGLDLYLDSLTDLKAMIDCMGAIPWTHKIVRIKDGAEPYYERYRDGLLEQTIRRFIKQQGWELEDISHEPEPDGII